MIAGLTSTVARQAIDESLWVHIACTQYAPETVLVKNGIAVSTETLLVKLRRYSGVAAQVTTMSARSGNLKAASVFGNVQKLIGPEWVSLGDAKRHNPIQIN